VKDENPYLPPNATPAASGAEQPRRSILLLRIAILVLGTFVFGMGFLFAASGVYFTLNPAKLQSGTQPVPASFASGDYPRLLVWTAAAVAFAAAMGWCAVNAFSTLRRWLG
jgi:hypothetical protein